MAMRISDSCAKCLYDRQKSFSDNPDYLREIKTLLDDRREEDTSPYMVYLFSQIQIRYFGTVADYSDIKRKYNDIVLEMEDSLIKEIGKKDDPLAAALMISRYGNYIDFGAMDCIDDREFFSLFSDLDMREEDKKTYSSFIDACRDGKKLVFISDNCGEIVLDKLLLMELKKRFPNLGLKVLVRGGEVLNDATEEDARYVGIDSISEIVSNGNAIAGTVLNMLPDKAISIIENADVILAKGQGNYESLSGHGIHAFYLFLCKCDLFTTRFNVPKLTGMFIEEGRDDREG